MGIYKTEMVLQNIQKIHFTENIELSLPEEVLIHPYFCLFLLPIFHFLFTHSHSMIQYKIRINIYIRAIKRLQQTQAWFLIKNTKSSIFWFFGDSTKSEVITFYLSTGNISNYLYLPWTFNVNIGQCYDSEEKHAGQKMKTRLIPQFESAAAGLLRKIQAVRLKRNICLLWL